jgi:pimeloyl-ACP methyl ester carboxylesterase
MRKYFPAILGFLSKVSPALAAKVAVRIFSSPMRIPRPESERVWHETSKKFFLKNGIAAFEWGEPSRPLVMLIHGWNGRGTQIASFAPRLVEEGFRVVALDGPGHGISPGKRTNPSAYAQFITDAQKELTNNGEAHTIIAHSFGGGSTVLAASRDLKVKKIVLIASPAFYERVVHFFARSMQLNQKAEECFFEEVTRLAKIAPRDLNIAAIGGKLNLPCLIVHDTDDTAVDYMSATAIHEAWPHSELLTTTGLGHRRILKDKNVIERVVRFIADKN